MILTILAIAALVLVLLGKLAPRPEQRPEFFWWGVLLLALIHVLALTPRLLV